MDLLPEDSPDMGENRRADFTSKLSQAKFECSAGLYLRDLMAATMWETLQDFKYTPLQNPQSDIRLLILDLNDSDDDVIRGRLEVPQSRSSSTPYQALSYTWGDSRIKTPICLNGSRFLVSRSLHGALLSLRRRARLNTKRSYGNIWIDAICINQGHPGERDEQVKRMKQIYEGAADVVIWIGEYFEPEDHIWLQKIKTAWNLPELSVDFSLVTDVTESSHAFALVCCLAFLRRAATSVAGAPVHFPDFLTALNCKDRGRLLIKADYANDRIQDLQAWAQLSRLFQRPWFERLWVIQELASARNAVILWGQFDLDWSLIEDAAKSILRPAQSGLQLPAHITNVLPQMGAQRITNVSINSMLNLDTANILTILHNTQYTKCTDPRDRLYAILGLVDANERADVIIDYSIPVEEVYIQWATRRIERNYDLATLSACSNTGNAGVLPSWVPDLRRSFGQDSALWSYTHDRRGWYLASRRGYISIDGSLLEVDGKFVGHINAIDNEIADLTQGIHNTTELKLLLLNTILRWEQMAGLEGVSNLHSCLLRFAEKNSRRRMDHYFWRQHCDALLRTSQGTTRPINHEASIFDVGEEAQIWHSEAVTTAADFEHFLFPRVHGCRIFVCDLLLGTRIVGIIAGNCDVKINDEIWFLQGSEMAFLLRKEPQKQIGRYHLLTPCTVAAWGALLFDDSRFLGAIITQPVVLV